MPKINQGNVERCHGLWVVVESWAGAFMGTILVFSPPAMLALFAFDEMANRSANNKPLNGVVYLICLVLLAPFAFLALWSIWSSIRARDYPLAFGVARRQPLWPAPLKPVVALFWAAYFLVGATSLLMWEELAAKPPPASKGSFPLVMNLVFSFATSYSANVCLLQAIAVFRRDEDFLRSIWRFRIFFDLLVAVLVMTMYARGFRAP